MLSKQRSPEFIWLFVDMILSSLSRDRCREQNAVPVFYEVLHQRAARVSWEVFPDLQALHQVKTFP